MKQVLLLLCLFHGSLVMPAQQPEPPLAETEWRIAGIGRYSIHSHDNRDAFEKSIVHLNSSEAIAAVHFGKDEYGIVKVNDKGTIEWELKLPGKTMGLGKADDKIIAFYEITENMEELHAITVDAKGKKLLDKVVHQNKERPYETVTVQNRPSGTFNNLLIRAVPANIKREWMYRAEVPAISSKAVFLDQNLTAVKTIDVKANEEYRFLGSVVNEEGDIYLCNKIDDDIVVDEYNGSTGATNRLHLSFDIKKGSGFTSVFNIDAQNGRNVLAAFRYTNKDKDLVSQVFQFDFKAKKGSSSNARILNRAYAKAVEEVEQKGIYKQGLAGGIEELHPKNIMRVADKLVVISEVRYAISGTYGGSYRNGAAVVSFLDNQLKPLKDLALIKQYDVVLGMGRSLGAYVQNDKLYLITNSLNGVDVYANLVCIINASTMSSEKFEIVNKFTLSGNVSAEPNATIWFDHSFLLSRLMPRTTVRKDITTMLQKVTF